MMMGVPAGGIAMVFERIPSLLDKGFPLWFLTVLATTSLAMMSVATILLSRLLTPFFKSYLGSGGPAKPKPLKRSHHEGHLSAAPSSLTSVTEETTRSFESAPHD